MVNESHDSIKEKRIACEVATRYLKDGMSIGLGTGSTVNILLDVFDEMNLCFKKSTFVSTSDRTTEKALKMGLNIDQDFSGELDVSIDGADEIDPNGNLIKGGGGALTREKKGKSAVKPETKSLALLGKKLRHMMYNFILFYSLI